MKRWSPSPLDAETTKTGEIRGREVRTQRIWDVALCWWGCKMCICFEKQPRSSSRKKGRQRVTIGPSQSGPRSTPERNKNLCPPKPLDEGLWQHCSQQKANSSGSISWWVGKDMVHPAVRQHSAVRSSNVLMHLENSHKKWFVWFQPHEVSRTAVLWRQELG